LCNAGLAVNPATGRCMMAPTSDASPDATDALAVCSGDYNGCGCGCCGGVPGLTLCYYPTLGQTATTAGPLEPTPSSCANAGCSLGRRYVCCLPAAPSAPSGATYTADVYIGGIDRFTISKSGTDCASVTFVDFTSGTTSALRIDAGARWTSSTGSLGTCGEAGATDQVEGALGTLVLRANGTGCVADLHATLFAFTAAGTVESTRLDVDGLVVPQLTASWCP